MLDREVRILFRKEWAQLVRSRGPFWTSLLLPVFFILLIPMSLVFTFRGAVAPSAAELARLPPGLRTGDPTLLILPLVMVVAGLVLPTMTATHSVISERESRTLELLVALPIRIGQILQAKFLAVLLLSCVPPLALLCVDAVVFSTMRAVKPGVLLALFVLLAAALAYGTASALVIGLVARDYRTANNLGGVFIAPSIFLSMGLLVALPAGPIGPLVLAGLLATAATVLTIVATRSVTFERLLR